MTAALEDLKVCPFCAESIKAAAIVCKHCGRDQPSASTDALQPRTTQPAPADDETAQLPGGGTTGLATVVRLLVLLLLTPVLIAIGSGTNGNAQIAAFLFFPTALALYALPTYEAWERGHPNLTGVAILNLLLGWTVLGWIGALVWGVSRGRTG